MVSHVRWQPMYAPAWARRFRVSDMEAWQTVRLRERRLTVLLCLGRIVSVYTGTNPPAADVTVDRLEATDGLERLSDDGRVLLVGAWGISTIATHLYGFAAYRTPKALMRRLGSLIAGTSLRNDMMRATVRAGLGLPAVGGDTELYRDRAAIQLQPMRITIES